jgi:hypothetical protein
LDRDENISSDVVRLAIFESLTWKWRDMYDNCESADCRGLSEAEFMATILQVEDMDKAERAVAKKKPANNPTFATALKKQGSSDRGSSRTNERNKNKRAKCFCQKCKELRRSEQAYTSHDQGHYYKATVVRKEWKRVIQVIEKMYKTSLRDRADSNSL